MHIKYIIVIAVLIFVSTSCSNDNTKILEKASKKICNCLDETVKLNEKLISVSKEDTTNIKVMAVMQEISKSADIGFACLERTLKQYKIKEKDITNELNELLEKKCPEVAEMIARE